MYFVFVCFVSSSDEIILELLQEKHISLKNYCLEITNRIYIFSKNNQQCSWFFNFLFQKNLYWYFFIRKCCVLGKYLLKHLQIFFDLNFNKRDMWSFFFIFIELKVSKLVVKLIDSGSTILVYFLLQSGRFTCRLLLLVIFIFRFKVFFGLNSLVIFEVELCKFESKAL